MRKAKLERGFYWRGSVIWTRWQGKQVTTGRRDPQAAYLERAEWERRDADPNYAASRTTRLDDAVTSFVEALRAGGRAVATLEYYATKLGHPLRIFGVGSPVGDVTPVRVSAYWAQRLKEGADATTVRKEITALLTLLRHCAHFGWYRGDVASLRPPMLGGTYQPRARWLPASELRSLCEALPRHRAAWVALAVAIGGRLSEVNRMRVADVDLEGGYLLVWVTKKKGSAATGPVSRRVPIAPFARPLLEFALRNGKGTGGRVVAPWGKSNANRDLRLACEALGIARCSPNDFRRTHATWLVQAGASSSTAAFMLGNTPAMIERVYGRQSAEAVAKLLPDRHAFASTDLTERETTTPNEKRDAMILQQKTPGPQSPGEPVGGLWLRLSRVRVPSVTPENKRPRKRPRRMAGATVTDLHRLRARLRRFEGPPARSFGELLDRALALGAPAPAAVGTVTLGPGGRGASAFSSLDLSVSRSSEREIKTRTTAHALATHGAGAREGSGGGLDFESPEKPGAKS